jgi:putative membrane protein
MTRMDPVRLMRSALLLGLALLIAKLFASGQMARYMSPALDPLSVLAGVLLAGMGARELRAAATTRRNEEPGVDHALTYLLVLLPLLLGLLVSPKALGSSALGGESASALVLAFAREPSSARGVTSSEPIQDVSDLIVYLRRVGEAGVGQQVHAIGLVARSGDLQSNEFVLLRYSIAHCVADARPIGLLIVAPQGAAWSTDQWVEIDGSLDSRERAGDRLVSIIADRIVPTEEPNNPYLQAL